MDLFEQFAVPTQEQWLAQIAREMKEMSLEGIELEPGIVTRPYLHPSAQPDQSLPLWSEPIDWAICVDIACGGHVSAPTANAALLSALGNGYTAVRLLDPELELLPEILEGVYLQMVDLRITGEAARNPAIFEVLASILTRKGLSATSCRIYLENAINHWDDEVAIARFLDIAIQYPTIKSLHLDATADSGYSAPLAALLRACEHLYHLIVETRTVEHCRLLCPHVSIKVGKHYFGEISKLRAWYLVWYNLSQRWQLPLRYPELDVLFDETAYTDQVYTNMIRATTMAMSAVIGGCTNLTVRPFDTGRSDAHNYGNAFGVRIAGNVQHLMKLESNMHTLHDPSAGSYYIEDLTRQIAEKAWSGFVRQ